MKRRTYLKQSSSLLIGLLSNPTYSSAFNFNVKKDVIIGH